MNARDDLMGIIQGITNDDYHAGPGVSNSVLSHMAESPAHCYAMTIDQRRPARQPREWMITGPLAHCAILEPDAMGARYVVVPDDAPKRPTKAQWGAAKPSPASQEAMAWWAGFGATTAGRQIIEAKQFADASSQLAAVLAVPELSALLATGVAEQSVYWIDPATGLLCKCRPDWVHEQKDGSVILLDPKTCIDASPDGFSKAAFKRGYHRQAAWYSRGYAIASGRRVAGFVFAAISKTYPFIATTYVLDDDAIAQGDAEVTELLSRYAECKLSGIWPGYGSGFVQIGLPAWAKSQGEIEVNYV